MTRKHIADIATANEQTLRVSVDNGGVVTLATMKGTHNRAVAKLSAETLSRLVTALSNAQTVMATSTAPTLSVELDRTVESRYAVVHVTGCRDLRDPEPLGEVSSLDAVGPAVSDATGWDTAGELYPYIAPCARRVLDNQATVN